MNSALASPWVAKLQRIFPDAVVNALLAIASAACFGIFLHQAATYTSEWGTQDAIGNVSRGAPDRKRAGSFAFAKAETGASLYFRDMVWVGPREQTELTFSDGTRLRLLENTFVVLLRRPGSLRGEATVQLLKGNIELQAGGQAIEIETLDEKVKLKDQGPGKIGARAKSERKIPAALPSSSAAKPKGIYPADRALLYLVDQSESRISLAWPAWKKEAEGAAGTLILSERSGAEILRQEVSADASVPVTVRAGQEYEWRVQGPRGVLVGPASFEVQRFSADALKDRFDPNSDRVIEMIDR